MTEHLPECLMYDVKVCMCICLELRRCEERVKRVERPLSFLKGTAYGRDCGWDEALNAAREAVFGARSLDVASGHMVDGQARFVWMNHALEAIDALREDSETPPPLPPSVGVPERRWT